MTEAAAVAIPTVSADKASRPLCDVLRAGRVRLTHSRGSLSRVSHDLWVGKCDREQGPPQSKLQLVG